jgi:activator of 2-hydroxyglutaryl-CoA dehydratase
MAKVLGTELNEMEALHGNAVNYASISSTCAVFAESEVISQLSSGTDKSEIVAGVHRSIANKASSLAWRTGVEATVVMSGGVALNGSVVKEISMALDTPVVVAPNPQILGALGAAYFAAEEFKVER